MELSSFLSYFTVDKIKGYFHYFQGYNSLILFFVLTIVSFLFLNAIRVALFKKINIFYNKHKALQNGKVHIVNPNILPYINKIIQIAIFVSSLLVAVTVSGTSNKFLVTFASKSILVFVLIGITYGSAIVVEIIIKKKYTRFSDISLITGFIKITIYIIGAMIIAQSVGVQITPLITALGIGGIAFAFAIQPTLANLFSGLHILASGQVSKGDYVVISDKVEGHVKDVAWRNTSIQSLTNVLHIVPNQVLSDAVVSNFSKPDKMFYITVPVRVAYSSNLDEVEQITVNTARKVLEREDIAVNTKEFDVIFRFVKFGESSIDFIAILPIQDVSKRSYTIHIFIKELQQQFVANNIEIPFPIRTILQNVKSV